MKIIKNKHYDEERALYHLLDTEVLGCQFKGPLDGESVLKETRNVIVNNCKFSLRYPLWHAENFVLTSSSMDELTRAALWYDHGGSLSHCSLQGIKCLRECSNIQLYDCVIVSPEFGWQCEGINIRSCTLTSEYAFLHSSKLVIDQLTFTGKYSFQYTSEVKITSSTLDTKDAFWHSKNVTVKDCTIKGEYLGWYSEGLTLINCHISGTQPFCYCKKLTLTNCTMEGCDLAFEYSEVEATIKGTLESIKNPLFGHIHCGGVHKIINEEQVYPCSGQVIVAKAKA